MFDYFTTTTLFIKFIAIAVLVLLIRWMLIHTSFIYILKKSFRRIEDTFHVYQSFNVPQFNDHMQENHLFRKVYLYVNSLSSMEDSDFTNLFSSGKKHNEILLELDSDQSVHDSFLGSKLVWLAQTKSGDETKSCAKFVLKIRKHDKRRILRSYLQYIHTVADEIESCKRKDLKLFINVDDGYQNWRSIPFTNPANLDTIAMDSDVKAKVRSDLDTFSKSKSYYHRLGRVWRRSYLLYGPSGTGKSTFIAAMANHLNNDVYDINLSKVRSDFDLKLLLMHTTGKSIVVIEDFDRFLIEKSTDLSSTCVLNFMDGLLSSCCGDERVMVYTMSDKERVDPTVLRPGRIDVHLHFPYCDFNSFKLLANNYLGVKEHKLFPQVEESFTSGASLSQAVIGELMIVNRNSPSRAIKSVIGALQINGDGGGGKTGGAKIARPSDTESINSEDMSGVSCKEGVNSVKEFRKFYDFLMMKNCKKSGPLDVSNCESKLTKPLF